MNFAENTDVMAEVVAKLKEAADQIEEHAKNISEGIAGLNEDWVGESYNSFKAQCDAFAPSMTALCNVLKAYAYLFENNVNTAAEALEEAVQGALG